jgi:tetratricopeptide (TPR) repeat protein
MPVAEYVDYFDILNLPETADAERIRTAIREERRIWNKRAGQADTVQKQLAEQRIRDLAEAERTLLDDTRRRAYVADRAQNKARAAAAAAAAPATADGRRDWLDEARSSYAAGNAHAANYAAREAIATNGADHEAWNIRANSSFILGNYADAGFEFREAIRLQPHNAGYHFDYGEAHAATRSWSDALAEYEVALQQSPGNPVYKTAIANVYLNTNRPQQALDLMEQVVKAEPKATVFQYYLAWALHDVNLTKWSTLSDGSVLITSPEQIRVTRQLSRRALELDFTDDPLRESLRDNLRRADVAEQVRWTVSGNLRWYVGAVVAALIVFFAGIGGGSAGAAVLGLAVVAVVVWAYVVRHHKPVWKTSSEHPAIKHRGV